MIICSAVRSATVGIIAGGLLFLVTVSADAQVVRRSFQNANGTRGGLFKTNGVQTGALGGKFRGGAAGAWNPAYGGAGAYGVAGTGPKGSPYYKYGAGAYNKQTGQGQYNSGGQATVNGKNYGGEQTTQYANGQGMTRTIDTDNKGDYTVTRAPDSRAVRTQTAPPGSGAPSMPSASSVSSSALNAPAP